MKLMPASSAASDDRVDGRLIEAANHFPHLAASAERHRAEAQLRNEHTRIRQHAIFHGSILHRGGREEFGSEVVQISSSAQYNKA